MPGSLRLDSLIPGLAHMRGSVELKVGVMSGGHNQTGGNSTPVAEYATYNEYGAHIEVTPKMRAYLHHMGVHLKTDTEAIDIPARSFLRGTLELNEDRYVEELARSLEDGTDPALALEYLGQIIEADVQKTIDTWEDPPNSPLTVRLKNKDTPLRRTGSLYRAITHTVEPEA